ncbi:MAG: hypothetical protein Q9195_008125, partial [Heterodermia aff. obscurata]
MATSNDPDHFFQTSSTLEQNARRAKKSSNTHGHPIRLPSKILAVIADPLDEGAVYVAESAGTARRVVLDTGSISEIFRSPTSTAPLTSLALSPSSPPSTLFAASWDQSIHAWDLATRAPSRRFTGAHTDFVKTILTTRTTTRAQELLISAGADALIVVWDLGTGARLHTLRTGHSSGILALAIDPESPAFALPSTTTTTSINIFSASSDRTLRRFALTLPATGDVKLTETDPSSPLIPHDTSIYALCFSPSSSDLWTASADGTAKCLSRERGWAVDTVLEHGGHVRAIAV